MSNNQVRLIITTSTNRFHIVDTDFIVRAGTVGMWQPLCGAVFHATTVDGIDDARQMCADCARLAN